MITDIRHALSARNFTPVFTPAIASVAAVDLYKQSKKSGSVSQASDGSVVLADSPAKSMGFDGKLDIHTWLPFAAPHYHISPDIKDYVLIPVITMPADLPNRNSVGFPLEQLVQFLPDMGCQSYKTWKGQPTFREHDHNDITKAFGVIADVIMRKQTGFGQGQIWKVVKLLAFDRTKNPEVVDRILKGELNSYSMGAYVESYKCSYCEQTVGKGCPHLDPAKSFEIYVLNGKLVYKMCVGIRGFETSVVENPAYTSAISDSLIVMRKQ